MTIGKLKLDAPVTITVPDGVTPQGTVVRDDATAHPTPLVGEVDFAQLGRGGDPLAYRKAIANYVQLTEPLRVAQLSHARNQPLELKPEFRSFFKFHEGTAPRGLVVLFHGLSASPAQWRSTAEALYAKGLDVFVPALPGHGIRVQGATEESSENEVNTLFPGHDNLSAWDDYLEEIYRVSRPSGRVAFVGISTGGMLAVRVAARHADERVDTGLAQQGNGRMGERIVRDVMVLSPFYDFASWQNQAKAVALDLFKSVKPGLLEEIVDLGGPNNPDGPRRALRYPSLSQMLGLRHLAKETKEDFAEKLKDKVPYHSVSSAADSEASRDEMADVAEAAADSRSDEVYREERKVPHAMIEKRELEPELNEKIVSHVLANMPMP